MSTDQIIYGFAPGVDAATNTFTCPRCRRSRDCQALNPICLACGYQDPLRFEVPPGNYVIGPWQKIR